MIIRRATEHDLPALVPLFHVIHELHAATHPDRFPSNIPSEALEAALREWMADESARWYVADDGEVAGYVYARFTQRPERFYIKAGHVCEIEHIAVHPRARHRGVARLLFEAIFADARKIGAGQIHLNVWHFNQEARQAFERMGFAPLCEVLHRAVPPD